MRQIRWYLDRLAAMSLPEITYRIRQRALVDWGRVSILSQTSNLKRVTGEKDWLAFSEGMIPHPVSLFLKQKSLKRFYCNNYPQEYLATNEYAEKLMKHTVKIFNQYVDLGEKINWSQDPNTGRIWPEKYWADIDTRDGNTIGGVKWVWELNRHHHFVTLGKAYALSGKKKYAQELLRQLSSWISANPSRKGVNWTSSLELAVRLINWSWALSFVQLSPLITEKLFSRIMVSIEEQASYIERHLSAYSSANNHRIGEAAGLAITGLSFPWLYRSEEWIDKGFKILTQEIEKQIYPDGVPAEQAIHYLSFILDFYLLAWRMTELNDLPVPEIWYKRLSAACDFIKIIMDENGGIPSLGDSDDAWVVKLDDRENLNNFRSILTTASVLLKRADLKVVSGNKWDEKSHWLLGDIGYQYYSNLTNESDPKKSAIFSQGGYCVMRSSQCNFVFDCGPLGYLSTAAHGHADALSFSMSLEGSPIFIDPGTYAYQEGDDWRTYFRSTAAHNTIEIDGQDQSEMLGTFLWGRKARSKILHWSTNPDYDIAIAEHDGFKHSGVIHRRTIIFSKKDFIIIVDDLLGKGEHKCSQFWHFPVECKLDLMNEKIRAKVNDRNVYLLPIEIDENTERLLYKGNYSPVQGWVSPRYGEIQEANVINYRAKTLLPKRWIFRIQIDNDENGIDVEDLRMNSLKFLKKIETEVIL